jgi:hypothetical protein
MDVAGSGGGEGGSVASAKSVGAGDVRRDGKAVVKRLQQELMQLMVSAARGGVEALGA